MVVDDTITYRMITKKVAESISGVEVMTTASNGKLALEKLTASQPMDLPDVIFLDVEMPVLDGISTLKKIRKRFPSIAVVMVSALSRSNANIIVECLNAGALDFITKPVETQPEQAKAALREDMAPILALVFQNLAQNEGKSSAVSAPSTDAVKPSAAAPSARPAPSRRGSVVSASPVVAPQVPPPSVHPPPKKLVRPTSSAFCPGLVLVGSSTGGPAALTQLLCDMGRKTLPIPMLIVQHMPPIFTASLAEQLTRASGLVVKEAEGDKILNPGTIYLAKGGYHLTLRRKEDGFITAITDGPKVNQCRPAVDVLLMSVMAEFSGQVLVIILTGMGRDGTNGVDALKRMGKAYCITQEKNSCVVYGMPRSVDEKGLSDLSLPLKQIGKKVIELCCN